MKSHKVLLQPDVTKEDVAKNLLFKATKNIGLGNKESMLSDLPQNEERKNEVRQDLLIESCRFEELSPLVQQEPQQLK